MTSSSSRPIMGGACSNEVNLVSARDPEGAMRWRKHPILRRERLSGVEPDRSLLVRRARAAAICGVLLARNGRLEEAELAFTRAAALPEVDLAQTDGFWDLHRGGMQAAVTAYEVNERFRDAAALGARVRRLYRPQLVRSAPVNLLSPGRTPKS